MNIWIDLTNSPHVTFFKPFIALWKKSDIDITITLRDLSNTEELANQEGWKYQKISGHGGKNRLSKLFAFIKRTFALKKTLSNKTPDIGVSHSGFCVPLVGKLLGFPTIYINDNEWALANFIAAPFATVTYFPKLLDKSKIIKWLKIFGANIKFYDGLKEAIYLSQSLQFRMNNYKSSRRDKVYFRPEPHMADYYSGFERDSLYNLIEDLSSKFKVIILPRDKFQTKFYSSLESDTCIVARKPLDLTKIASDAKFFIGSGGTMSRELAILGIPTISTYTGNLLAVDKYLIEHGFLCHMVNYDLNMIKKFLKTFKLKKSDLMDIGSKSFKNIEREIAQIGCIKN